MAETRRRRARTFIGAVLVAAELVGAGLVGAALRPGSASSQSAVYSVPAGCASCTVRLDSVQVQSRRNGVLFVVGPVPDLPKAFTEPVRLQADGLDLVLAPGSTTRFGLSTATFDGQALDPDTVSAGLQGGALLVLVRNGVLTTPMQFALGTWNGSRYLSRLPATGSLVWSGSGRPVREDSATITTPGASPGATQVTGLADSCRTVPFGHVPSVLAVATLDSGSSVDPRRGVAANFVGLRYAVPLAGGFKVQPAFSVAVVVHVGHAPTRRAGLAIDHLGQLQLWAVWNGTTLAKAVREWNGKTWTTLIDDAATPLTIDMATTGVTFWWPTLKPGDTAAAVVAVDGGCSAADLGAGGRAEFHLTGLL